MSHNHSHNQSTPLDCKVRHVSKCTIKPNTIPSEAATLKQSSYLTPWDLAMLSAHHIQWGLLFHKPLPSLENPNPIPTILDQLQNSLSLTLSHFFPLSFRLTTQKQDNPPSYSVLLDCKPQGVEFIYAVADGITISDVLSPVDVPPIVESFFAIVDPKVGHDSHTIPFLTIQVTELVNGLFIGCSFNHVIGDGTSFCHFLNSWAEICRSNGKIESISHPPITKRFFLNDTNKIINLPFSHYNQFIDRYKPEFLRERMFHFSQESIAKLKLKANKECNFIDNKISSFQALAALIWKTITRAQRLPYDQKTSCRLAIDNRLRLNPPLSLDYFGNCNEAVAGSTTVGEVLNHTVGWAAKLLHEAVNGHTDRKIREFVEKWMKNPIIYQAGTVSQFNVMIGSSPRFDLYGCEFGWGKAVAIRTGFGNKCSGKVSSFPGREGGGSMDMEICLPPESMAALELDEEFLDVVSPHEVMSILD